MNVLIVEDEALVALDLAAQIQDLGHVVVGPAHNLDKAMALVDNSEIDFALLDVNLNGSQSIPVARRLQDDGVDFVFLTGYGSPKIVEDFGEATILSKPISEFQLKRLMSER